MNFKKLTEKELNEVLGGELQNKSIEEIQQDNQHILCNEPPNMDVIQNLNTHMDCQCSCD